MNADFGTWAGIPPRFYTLYYWKEQLSFVRIVFNAGFFSSVLEVFEAKYGAATHFAIDTVRARIGVAIPRQIYRWDNSTSFVELSQFTSTLSESEVRYALKSWAAASDARRKERLKEKLP